jgi:hypothetical protein
VDELNTLRFIPKSIRVVLTVPSLHPPVVIPIEDEPATAAPVAPPTAAPRVEEPMRFVDPPQLPMQDFTQEENEVRKSPVPSSVISSPQNANNNVLTPMSSILMGVSTLFSYKSVLKRKVHVPGHHKLVEKLAPFCSDPT